MDTQKENLTQEEIEVIFDAVKRLRRIKNRELTKKEIEKLIYNVRVIAQN